MRVAFLGSPDFAVPSLLALHSHPDIDVVRVVTQPDRPAGRGRALTASAVKVAAADLQLPILQPESLRDPDVVLDIRLAVPDMLVVVAYGELLRRDVLTLAPHGCVNVHPSLLPRYRGAAPIPAAILAGDITTGVSIMQLVRRLDAGPIISQHECAVEPRDTTRSLSARLSCIASAMLPLSVLRFAAGEIEPIPQDESQATYTREWTVADARIDWTQPATQIDRLVRASDPWPVAWSTIDGQRVRVLAANVDDAVAGALPGTIDAWGSVPRVATGDGWLILDVVQASGKRPVPATDWLRGLRRLSHRFDVDDET